MVPMTVDQVSDCVHGCVVSHSAIYRSGVLTSVVTDSRKAESGSLLIAIKGEHVDGHDFLDAAHHAGAVAAIVDHEVRDSALTQIVVPNTVEALALLAQRNLQRRRESPLPFDIIGITGSVGKTTTKDLLSHLLSILGSTVAPIGSFNNEIGLPLTALNVSDDTRFLVAEMGANHIGEIANLTRIAPPDVSLVLTVGVAHLGEFGSVENIASAKAEIIEGLAPGGVAVLNADDFRVAAMRDVAPGQVLWFALAASTRGDVSDGSHMTMPLDICATPQYSDDMDRPTFTLRDRSGGEVSVSLAIPGAHNVLNAAAAATVAQYFGMSLKSIAAALQDVGSISPHRMAVSHVELGEHTFTLIDDSYNANPDSMKAGLNSLLAWHRQSTREPYRVAVLGAMLELGQDAAQLHRQVGAYARHIGVDEIICVGSDTDEQFDAWAHALAQGASGGASMNPVVQWAHGVDDAERMVSDLLKDHYDVVVLLKGSHFSGLCALAERWADSSSNPGEHNADPCLQASGVEH